MQETQVGSLGQEDSPEEGNTTHSSIFAWTIPCTEGPGGLQSMESHISDMTKRLKKIIIITLHVANKTIYPKYIKGSQSLTGNNNSLEI